jgi:hypothetical protein
VRRVSDRAFHGVAQLGLWRRSCAAHVDCRALHDVGNPPSVSLAALAELMRLEFAGKDVARPSARSVDGLPARRSPC